MDPVLPPAVVEALQPLEQFERSNTLAWQWRYRWRTSQEGGGWHAEVQAGYADDQWHITGACPRWGGSGVDQASALADAVGSAMHYWSIGRSGMRP